MRREKTEVNVSFPPHPLILCRAAANQRRNQFPTSASHSHDWHMLHQVHRFRLVSPSRMRQTSQTCSCAAPIISAPKSKEARPQPPPQHKARSELMLMSPDSPPHSTSQYLTCRRPHRSLAVPPPLAPSDRTASQ